jgi:hypothetical protein
MATRKAANRYPRPGDRVAPATLRQVLLEPLPAELVAGTSAEGLKLCDLDEHIWERLSAATIEALAEVVVARVAAACARKALDQRHFPRPPQGLKLANLRLEHRTLLCLAREGFGNSPASLGGRTLGEILAIRAFGPRCLVDLLSALETLLANQDPLCEELTLEARQLAELPEAKRARNDDSRFAELMSEIDVESHSALELASRLIQRSQDPPDPQYVIEQLRELRSRIRAMAEGTLEEELIQIFASTPHQRNHDIVVGYYGWRDGQPHTLAQIGARYGMTRERTRQICAKMVRRRDRASILAPVMDRTLALLRARLPSPVDHLEKSLVETGLTAVGLRLSNVEEAARLLGRPVPFALVRVDDARLAVDPKQVDVPAAVVELAKKEIYYHGAAPVDRLVDLLQAKFAGLAEPRVVRETLRLLDGFCWLDEPSGWFRLLTTSKHGLPRAIEKVLSVASEISASELRTAVSRNRRMWQTPPPEKVILEFCRQMRDVRVEGQRVVAKPSRDWRKTLTGVEAQLVKILKEHGPIMERGALEDLCVGSGMNRFSFHAFIACSPVIAQYGHSIYGLLGAQVSSEAIRRLVDQRRVERTPMRVLDDHGQTEDGRVWLRYRLSKAASTYAVVTIPSALKDVVNGRFDLLDGDGRHVGTLAARDGRAWGLGAFLRRRQARVDDRVTITVDLTSRTAVIAIEASQP